MKQGFQQLTHRKNLKSCTESGATGYNVTEAVNGFYSEIKYVDWNNPIMTMTGNRVNGHFMALVDKTAGLMGVGCTPNTVTVHNYNGSAITIFILRMPI